MVRQKRGQDRILRDMEIEEGKREETETWREKRTREGKREERVTKSD